MQIIELAPGSAYRVIDQGRTWTVTRDSALVNVDHPQKHCETYPLARFRGGQLSPESITALLNNE